MCVDLQGTMDLVLTIGADNITKMETWVDALYGVHHDCKSHTGGCISFGWGYFLLNVKSKSPTP